MSIAKDQRHTLTIPYPSHIPRARGINAVNKFSAQTKVDYQPAERDLIDEAAKKIGITRSTFIRWVSAHAAKDVLRVYQESPEPVQAG